MAKFIIKSHAELEKYHYHALSNPQHQAEGMADVIREEMMMNMPVTIIDWQKAMPPSKEGREPEWSKKQWDRIRQLEGMVNHLQGKVEEMMKAKTVGYTIE